METRAFPVTFGDWIKQRRKALDLTQERLAHQVGCSVVLIRKIESEERRPSRQIASLMAQALQIPSEEHEQFIKIARQERDFIHLVRVIQPQQTLQDEPENSGQPVLPAPTTSFIGREHELSTILELILHSECRLLTLVGPGGIGKTRLALETAHSVQDSYSEQFPDGIVYISLTQLSSGMPLIPVIADHLQIQLNGARPQHIQVLAFLKNKRLLFVFDNLEHLLPQDAPVERELPGIDFLGQVLTNSPNIKIIATSRERLNLLGEWLFELSGLPVPEIGGQIGPDLTSMLQYSSINLFVQHARRVAPDFKVEPGNLDEIIRICQMVEGLPLGIELAASWVRVLTPGEIAVEISRSLDFLEATIRDIPARHRSLRAVFDHSWMLLNGEEQDLLRKLSIFHSGFDRRAAEEVCEANLASLSALVDKSLIYRSGTKRYELHELIRQYAAEKLERDQDELLQARARHSHYYLGFLQDKEAGLKSQAQKEVGEVLVQEIDNVRAAWDWGFQFSRLADIQNALRCLYWFYDVRGRLTEGAATFHGAVVNLKAANCTDSMHNQVTGHCLAVEGWFAFRLGQFAEARCLLEESLNLLESAPDSLALNEARAFLGALSYITGEYGRAIELLGRAIDYGKTSGDHWLTAHALGSLGRVAQLSGDYVKAHAIFTEGLEFWNRIGDLRGRTYALAYLGNIEINLGEYSEANHHLSLSLELSRATGDSFSIGTALNHLGLLAYKRGDYHESIALFEQGIRLFELLGEQASLGWLSNNLAHSYLALGQFEQGTIPLRRAMQIARQSQIAPLMLDTLVGWNILQVQAGPTGQIASELVGIAHHPASTQSVRERVSLALGNMGYSDAEQKRLAANAAVVSPEALVDQALKSSLTTAQP